MTSVDLKQGYYTKTGTVLLRRDSSKDGQSLLLFLRELGPRWVQAPSAATGKRFGGSTEPLTWGNFSIYQSPTKLYLQGAVVRDDFLDLRSSPASLLCALRIYKLTSKEAPTGCENDALLRMLWSALLQLREKCPPYIVDFRFTWRLLNLMGIAPSLKLCAQCGKRLTHGGAMTREGMRCPDCATGGIGIMDAAEITELRRSVILPHDKFIKWSQERHNKGLYLENIKKLSPYFSNMR